jgi:DNA repair exonuclease SbcCD ATPase subunit
MSSGGMDEETLNQLYNRIQNLEHEIDAFKNEFSRWLKDFQDSLNNKADIETVKALEQSLLDRLNEIVKALGKQFADRADTRKALKLLEKNLKNMYDLFMNKGHDQEDDAMFTKKPLGGMSCASCAKDVVDMYGKRVDY